MPITFFIWLVISGLLGGAILGSSGMIGPFIIPVLMLLGFSSDVARGTCLLSELLVTAIGAIEHKKAKNVDKNIILAFLPGVLTVFLGAYLSVNLPESIMKVAIGVFEVAIGIAIFFTVKNKIDERGFGRITKKLLMKKLIIISLLAGFVKGFFGAGWGPIGIGLYIVLGIDPAIVVGSSLIVRLILDFAGGLTYASMNLFNFEAFIVLTLSGCFSVSWAVKVTKMFSQKGMRVFLGFSVIFLGLLVIIDAILLLGI
ncbi:sulfite exporter TauE/SafE family protein [Candidatus Bathyarchaeota archaeon]|nr:sulfite exporter TauE/SafE family protein [Candidatus Bathyarchaeota archaeon]